MNPTKSAPHPAALPQGEIVDENPTHIWIEPTNRCNTKCAHCGHFYGKFGEDMDEALYERVLAQATSNLERVELIGYGEPFMARNFNRMFDDMAARGVHIFSTTNGILLRKDETVAKLVRTPMTLCLSIDGARAETFEWVRRLIKWEKMIETLECIKRNMDAAGAELRMSFRFNFVAMKNNIGDLPELVRLAHRYGAQEVFVLPLGGEDAFAEMEGQSLNDSPHLVSAPYLEALEVALEHGIHLSVPAAFRPLIVRGANDGPGLSSKLRRSARRARLARIGIQRDGLRSMIKRKLATDNAPRGKAGVTYCSMPWKDAYFASDGTVYPCCIMGEKLGDMKRQEWPEIWNGPAYRNLRRTVHSWNPTGVCRHCALPTGINGGDEHHHIRYFSQFRSEPVALDDPALRLQEGFHEIERNDGEVSHVWMRRQGLVSLPMRPGARFLRLRIIAHAPRHDANPGFATIAGLETEPFDNTCQHVHLPLNGHTGAEINLRIEMENEFDAPPDDRLLALAICGVEFLY